MHCLTPNDRQTGAYWGVVAPHLRIIEEGKRKKGKIGRKRGKGGGERGEGGERGREGKTEENEWERGDTRGKLQTKVGEMAKKGEFSKLDLFSSFL